MYKVGVALISNFLVASNLCLSMPSSIDLFPTHTLISSFLSPPSLAIFKRDRKGSSVLVQSFCLLYKTFRKLKNFFSPEHLAMTDAFSANLSRGKSLYINETLPVSMNSSLIFGKTSL